MPDAFLTVPDKQGGRILEAVATVTVTPKTDRYQEYEYREC